MSLCVPANIFRKHTVVTSNKHPEILIFFSSSHFEFPSLVVKLSSFIKVNHRFSENPFPRWLGDPDADPEYCVLSSTGGAVQTQKSCPLVNVTSLS